MNKQKIMLSILKEINDFNLPTEMDYGIDIVQFYKICKSLESEGFLRGVADMKEYIDGSHEFSIESIEITISGIKYINENTMLYKGYKGLKEIRDWLPL